MELDRETIYSLVSEFLREDLGRGDITTRSVVLPSARGRGHFFAKQQCVIAGLEVAEAVFTLLDSRISIESFVLDGDWVEAGREFARTEGAASALLGGERVALNLLQRLSGIATLTRQYVDAVKGTGAEILDTRKTTPGLRTMEKYAVLVGGGRNHRFGLDDGVLIKDNHIALAGGVEEAVRRARAAASHLMKIEVEVSNLSQVKEALAAGADVIMLDNMPPSVVAEAVRIIRQSPSGKGVLTEASGGITLDNVRQYAEAGVDMISVGALTHSAPAIDISFKITIA